MGAEQALKRIPRIKFPQRHPKPSASDSDFQPHLHELFSVSWAAKQDENQDFKALPLVYSPNFSHIVTKFPFKLLNHFKFPLSSVSETQATAKDGDIIDRFISRSRSDVPAPPINTAVGGKASLLPKRTPVSEREIEAILLGGCL